MTTKTPGVGSVYLGSYKDKDDNWLDGANTYRLHVPTNAPAFVASAIAVGKTRPTARCRRTLIIRRVGRVRAHEI
jgi:hypothetical protein